MVIFVKASYLKQWKRHCLSTGKFCPARQNCNFLTLRLKFCSYLNRAMLLSEPGQFSESSIGTGSVPARFHYQNSNTDSSLQTLGYNLQTKAHCWNLPGLSNKPLQWRTGRAPSWKATGHLSCDCTSHCAALVHPGIQGQGLQEKP